MSEKEKKIVEKLCDAIPKLSDFDKGYILGKVEGMSEQQKENEEKNRKEWKLEQRICIWKRWTIFHT